MELHIAIISSIGICVFIYLWMRKEKQASFEEGICYALAEHAKSNIKYKVYDNEDGEKVIEVAHTKEKK
jgi:hypothetical protein